MDVSLMSLQSLLSPGVLLPKREIRNKLSRLSLLRCTVYVLTTECTTPFRVLSRLQDEGHLKEGWDLMLKIEFSSVNTFLLDIVKRF